MLTITLRKVTFDSFWKTLPKTGLIYALGGPSIPVLIQLRGIRTSSPDGKWEKPNGPRKWPKKNNEVFPPQAPGEERRPAVRGMSIDEAIKQLTPRTDKGSGVVKEVLLEAQQLAVEQEHVEYKSNLWIAESFVGKGDVIKGLRRHARRRFGRVEYKFCHYFVRLVEGTCPENYFQKEPTGNEKLKEYLDSMRNRRIVLSL